MKLIVQKPFSWAHRGVEVEHFEAGQEIETEDQDLIDVSMGEGWVVEPAAPPPAPAPTPAEAPTPLPTEAPMEVPTETPAPAPAPAPKRAKK